ncbi:MAG TPA: LytTR family DNA-binding domain-containing protein [Pyrinomonadaceae bacterium]|nr:LytTR family DNA-binding domain-containing protein [Pyrinomonadaceae bacterium]
MGEAAHIRTLIVDDEPLARVMMREMLARDSDVEVVGECVNGHEAVEAILACAPDLIFLDVQMPEVGGFEVLEALESVGPMPHVIFVTAYDQYAVRAFEVHALDYLLKPFDRERFEVSWRRAKAQILRERNGQLNERILSFLEGLKAESNYLERLVIKSGGRIFFLETEEIDWVEAEGNYVSVHAGKKSHLIRETISNLESKLDPKKFLRIHRSSIVNISRIQELQPWFHGEYHILLLDGTQLTLSRNYRERLQEALGKVF